MRFATLSVTAAFSLACGGSPAAKEVPKPLPKATTSKDAGKAPTSNALPPVEPPDPESLSIRVGGKPKTYSGPEGLLVDVVPLEGDKPERALVRVRGVESVLNGVPLVHSFVRRSGDNYSWRTIIDGSEYDSVTTGRSWRGSRLRVFLPDQRGVRLSVRFDEEETAKLDTDEVFADYRREVESGRITKLASFNRGRRMEGADAEFAEATAELAKSCGGQIVASIDWSTVSDKTLSAIGVGSMCADGVEAIASFCARDTMSAEELRTSVSSYQCKWGKPGLSLSGKTVVFSPDPETDPRVVAAALLRAELGAEREVARAGNRYLIIEMNDSGKVWLGDGKSFHEHRQEKINSTTYRYLWSPAGNATLKRGGGSWEATCGSETTAFKVVDRKTREKVLARAKLKPATWNRSVHVVARDDDANYYLVDRVAGVNPKYRFFFGKKEQMTEVKISDVGEIYGGISLVSARGTLRVATDGSYSDWLAKGAEPKQRVALGAVPHRKRGKLAYGELGVYKGADLGAICPLN